MKDILDRIILLAEAQNAEENIILKKYDPDEMGISGDDLEFMEEARPKRNELKNYLKALTQGQLECIAAVMYGGREFLTNDERPTFEKVVNNIKGDLHLDAMISEKEPLPEYLRAGMSIYKSELGL